MWAKLKEALMVWVSFMIFGAMGAVIRLFGVSAIIAALIAVGGGVPTLIGILWEHLPPELTGTFEPFEFPLKVANAYLPLGEGLALVLFVFAFKACFIAYKQIRKTIPTIG